MLHKEGSKSAALSREETELQSKWLSLPPQSNGKGAGMIFCLDILPYLHLEAANRQDSLIHSATVYAFELML